MKYNLGHDHCGGYVTSINHSTLSPGVIYGVGDTPQQALTMLRLAIRLRRQVVAIETGRATRGHILDNPSYGSIKEDEMVLAA